MKSNIGVNEEEVHVECAFCPDERTWYVHRVVYRFVDIRGCLSQEQLDQLVELWITNMQCDDLAAAR